MRYLIINPYKNANHGIANYIHNMKEVAGSEIDDIYILENSKNLSPIEFRKYVKDYVLSNYGKNEVIIEAPEAKASTLLLPRGYKVHIRLHCPLAVAQLYDRQSINQVEFSHELRVINKATIVSSPSYGLLKELSSEVDVTDYYIYKNPIITRENTEEEKIYDVIFIGRYQVLKGCEELNNILEYFPENYNVLIFGSNCRLHKLSPKVKCNVTIKNEIKGEEKFNLLSQAKCLIQLSRFENCSMVILEAFSCSIPVVCWDVGGSAEIADRNVLHAVEYLNFEKFTQSVMFFVENRINPDCFKDALVKINNDFKKGFLHLVNNMNNGEKLKPYHGINYSENKMILLKKTIKPNEFYSDKKIRVLGIGYSNEHIEELWAPVISYLDYDARYICRRPQGFHTVFKHPEFPITKGHYTCFDWINDETRLEKVILNYKPNLILFHNGLHPSYQKTLQFIRGFNVPILYSELGWFPQKDHVYFDKIGVNAKSYIATQSFESFTGELCEKDQKLNLIGDYALLALQLENDTNLLVSSPDFKKNLNIIKYVKEQISLYTKIVVKGHPLDKNSEIYKNFCEQNNLIYSNENIETCLKNAHSVISVNSTVLLEALSYRCNIYHLGDSILENKNVAISCKGVAINSVWKNYLSYNINNRKLVINAFKSRQINLLDIRKGIKPNLLSIQPFMEMPKFDVSSLIKRQKLAQKNSNIINEALSNIKTNSEKSIWKRKLNKLNRTPTLFFIDFFRKQYFYFSRFFTNARK